MSVEIPDRLRLWIGTGEDGELSEPAEADARAELASDEFGVRIEPSGVGRGGDMPTLLVQIGEFALTSHGIYNLAQTVYRAVGRLRERGNYLYYDHDSLRFICLARILSARPELSADAIHVAYESGYRHEILDPTDESLFVFAAEGREWVYAVLASGFVQVAHELHAFGSRRYDLGWIETPRPPYDPLIAPPD